MDLQSNSQNIAAILDIHAETRGNHPAILSEDTVWSYTDLANRVKAQASALNQNGIGCGDLVGLCMRDCAEHLAAMFALARIGAIMLPMDIRWNTEEKQRFINHFQPKILIIEDPTKIANVRALKSETYLSQAEEANPKLAPKPI
ncbi:MAG: AMP-binding protein, partial [Alphaproteobacteria bacterium]